MFPITKPRRISNNKKTTIYGDRFIPNRATSKTADDKPFVVPPYITSRHHQCIYQALRPKMHSRIYQFSSTTRIPVRIQYQQPKRLTLSLTKSLDAPDIGSDYYTHPIAWSTSDLAIIALNPDEGGSIYSTPISTPKNAPAVMIQSKQLLDIHANAIASFNASQVASAWSDGCMRLHNIDGKNSSVTPYTYTIKTGHTPISTLTVTSPNTLVIGDEFGYIMHVDTRTRDGVTERINTSVETPTRITGLAYDGEELIASGSNNNQVKIWSLKYITSTPVNSHTAHTSAVKALTFQGNRLTTAGGSSCRKICQWQFNTHRPVTMHQTSSQITGLHYLSDPNYMVTSHGHGDPSLQIWHIGKHAQTHTLLHRHAFSSHEGRALALIKAPDNSDRLAVGLEGESFRFFSTHGIKAAPKEPEIVSCLSFSAFSQSIR